MDIFGRTFTIGADPEIFMGKGGKFVSAHEQPLGDKEHPRPVDCGAVQVDGMALEFNINPAEDLTTFKKNLYTVQEELKSLIGDYEFLKDCSVHFDQDFLKEVPHKNKALGCSSEFNGWSLDEYSPPNSRNMMRTAGGHIHIGGFHTNNEFSKKHFMESARLAQLLDEHLGVYSLIWDKDDERRSMYGRPGSFRPKTYGMEYRTLSNKWLFDENLIDFVYSGVKNALRAFVSTDAWGNSDVFRIIARSDRKDDFFKDNEQVNVLKGLGYELS